MFQFGFREYLWLYAAVPAAVCVVWLAARRRRRLLATLGDLPLVERLTRSVSRRSRALKTGLIVASLAFLVTSLGRPQFGTRIETVSRSGQDVVVALDVSASMMAEDIAPSRLQKAKHAIETLIGRLRGDRIGLVAFAGEAFVQSPLTADYGAAVMFLRSMDPSLIPVPGTNVVSALTTGIDAFVETERQHRVLILMTDGEDHEGGIDDVLQRALAEGVTIHTVGLGSPDGVPIPHFDDRGRRQGFKRDENNEVVLTRLDETAVESMARTTGGRYFRATPGENEIGELADQIAGMAGSEAAAREITLFDEQFQVFLGFALALLTIEFLIPERRRKKDEWKGRFQ